MLAFAMLFGLVGGFLLGAAVSLPDALSETWRTLWVLTGLVGAAVGLGVAVLTGAVWVLVERRTPSDRDLLLMLLPPLTAFLVVVTALLVLARSTTVLTMWPTWFLGLGAALAAMLSMPWVGWRRKVDAPSRMGP